MGHFSRILLHIGVHKTGTSAIQRMCNENRAVLRKNGVYYPSGYWHGPLASCFAENKAGYVYNRHEGRSDVAAIIQADQRYLADFEREICQAGCDRLALSYEGFIDLNSKEIAALREFLLRFADQVQVLAYCRHPLSFAPSEISQRAKMGMPTGRTDIGNPPIPKFRDYFEKFVSVFGLEQVKLSDFAAETLYKNDVRCDFLSKLGLPDLQPPELRLDQAKTNESLSAEAITIAEAMADLSPPGTRGYLFVVRYSQLLSSITGSALVLSDAEQEGIAALAKPHLDYLESQFGLSLRAPATKAGTEVYFDPAAVRFIAEYILKNDPVSQACRWLLDRKPESDAEVRALLAASRGNASLVRENIMRTPEFHQQIAPRSGGFEGEPRSRVASVDVEENMPMRADRSTPEQVAWGYRYLLGREPESEKIIALQARRHPDWRSFRNSVLASSEFKGILTSLDLPSKWVAAAVFGGKRMIWLDLRDDFVSRGALVDSYETIESAFISALLRPGDVFLDIGANIGWFTLLASTLVGESGRVHAFEPRRPTVDYLRRSVAMNGLQSMVTVHEFGLADVEGEFRLAWKKNSRNPGHSYLVDREMDGLETIPIQLRTLDSLRLDKVDFVKLDVEGAEPKVLAGGRNTFETHRPIVLSELYPEQLRTVTGISPGEYIAKFRSMDYQAFMVDQHRASEAVDDFPSDFATDLTNIALIPSEKLESVAAMLVAAGIDRPKWSQRTRPNAAAVSTKPAKSVNNEGAVTREGGTVTREQIRDAYICVLGREPEAEQAYQAHMEVKSIADLRYILMLSLEYRSLFQSILQAQERDTLVLIRVERTGGTTLHNVLAANFTPDKVAPLEEDVLRSFSPFDSVKYDFFSGHCDYEIALAIPRPAKKFVSLFRKPAERLVSFYRFGRSQPPTADLGQKHPYRLANTLSAEDFFSHSAIRSWAKANNNYLRVFGTSLERPIDPTDERAALSLATERIKHLDAIGLTHRMDESVRIICKSLGFPLPERFESLPASHPQLENVPPVEMTERLAKALEELTSYDEIIYQTAVDEFERRLQAGGKSERPAAVSLKTARRSRR